MFSRKTSKSADLSLVRTLFVGVSLTASLLAASPAMAQTSDEKAAADALFDAARDLMNAEEYAAACPKFQDSHDLDPAVGTLLNLGLCYKKAGQTASAWTTYREAAALARQLGQAEREKLARKEVEALEGQLTKLVVEVSTEASEITKLTVTRNGKPLRKTMWGVPLAVDPGEVTVEASAPGYVTRRAEVTAHGEGKTITFKVPVLTEKDAGAQPLASTGPQPEEEDPPQEAASVEPAPEPSADRGRSAWPYVLGGAGLLAAGGGTYFAFSSKTNNDDALELCTTGACSSLAEFNQHKELVDDARLDATFAYIGWGVGGAALAGAAIWFLVDTPKNESALTVTPLVGAKTWGIGATGSF
jgi:serine/threonine-protein kinase